MARVQSMQDWHELEVLQSIFFHAVDRRNYEAIPSLYTKDAIDDRGAFRGSVSELVEWVKQAYAGIESSSHLMTNMLCAFDGDTAESEGRELVFIRTMEPNALSVIISSRQFDRYERQNGEWLFSHRSLCTDWAQVVPETQPFLGIAGMPKGVAGASDSVYQRLPLLLKSLHLSRRA